MGKVWTEHPRQLQLVRRSEMNHSPNKGSPPGSPVARRRSVDKRFFRWRYLVGIVIVLSFLYLLWSIIAGASSQEQSLVGQQWRASSIARPHQEPSRTRAVSRRKKHRTYARASSAHNSRVGTPPRTRHLNLGHIKLGNIRHIHG